jgi:hypothetical protein
MDELFASKKESRDPAFLVHAAADIIAAARECFDYLGQDIVDLYIIPFTKSTKFKKKYESGALRAYFPFHELQVKNPDAIFHEVKTSSLDLYDSLVDFTEDISSKKQIPNTLFFYHSFLEMKDMVNEKKHDKLIAFVADADQEYLIENESFKMILPMKGQVGWKTFSVTPGSTVSKVTEYRFAYNDQEVGKFCLFASKATQLVLTKFYDDYFA